MKKTNGSLDSENSQSNKEKIHVYSITHTCFSCQNKTKVLTYIKFDDGTNEDLLYPWDKKRLQRNMSSEAVMNYMMNPGIELMVSILMDEGKRLSMVQWKTYQ